MRIVVTTVPHRKQRYPTTGDWLVVRDPETGEIHINVTVSEMGDPRASWPFEAAIAVHEIVEALLCLHRGVDEAAVTRFDKLYEDLRERNRVKAPQKQNTMASLLRARITPDSEPGDDPAAPYHIPHSFATSVERMLLAAFGMSWWAYEEASEALYMSHRNLEFDDQRKAEYTNEPEQPG